MSSEGGPIRQPRAEDRRSRMGTDASERLFVGIECGCKFKQ
jgi:hypothetical protein